MQSSILMRHHFLSLELMADVILYPSTTTQCSISFHPSVPPNCSRFRYSSKRVNKLLGDTQKPLWLSLLFIQYGPGFYLSIFILCWKIVADNLRNKHGRIKLHDVLVPLSTLPILLSSPLTLPPLLPIPVSQSNLAHSSDGGDKLGEHVQGDYVC